MSNVTLSWHEWFSESILNELDKDFERLLPLLRRNKLLKLTVRKWIREQISKNAINIDIQPRRIEEFENQWILSNLEDGYNEKTSREKIFSLQLQGFNEELLRSYAVNELRSIDWARNEWGHLIPQIYLERKDSFDKVKIRSLSIDYKYKGIATEVYYALKGEEYGFAEAALKFRNLIINAQDKGIWMTISEMKPALKWAVQNAKVGVPSKPLKIENRLVIIQVDEIIASKLDTELEERLLRDILNDFISHGVEEICSYINEKEN